MLQKKVLKSITFNDITSPAMPIFHNLELLTLADIHNLQVVSFVYECVNGLSPSYFGDYFKTLSSTHAMGTRQATMGNLFLQRRNTDQYGIRSVQYSGVKLWNSVPAKIRVSTSITKFRSELKSIYHESSDILEIKKTVNKELKKVQKWLDTNPIGLEY